MIAEIETDKATMEVEAVDEGVLGKILVADGTAGVKVNEPIAVLVEEGEAVPAGAAAEPAKAQAAAGTAAPRRAEQRRQPTPARAATAASRAPRRHRRAQAARRCRTGMTAGRAGERIFASPLARRMAKQAGIDLSALKGTRPERPHRQGRHRGRAAGRREAASRRRRSRRQRRPPGRPRRAPAAPAPPITAPHHARAEQHDAQGHRPPADRGQADDPAFLSSSMDIEIDALLKLRAELNAKSPKEGPGAFKLSVNDLVIKAAAITLRRVPKVNASYTEDEHRRSTTTSTSASPCRSPTG